MENFFLVVHKFCNLIAGGLFFLSSISVMAFIISREYRLHTLRTKGTVGIIILGGGSGLWLLANYLVYASV